MKNILIITMMVFLLVMPMITAKSLGAVEPINWKAKQLTIKDDGVYDGKNLIKEESKAEIWIDRKEGNVYYIDSLVADDTTVNIVLFYDIQPDTINYKSHTGKYELFVTWTWKDNCTGEDCSGGWATINDIILEYAEGSNTFTAAISGATWMNDGINVALTAADYEQSGNTFTISNINYGWSEVITIYSYEGDTAIKNISSSYRTGIANFGNKIPQIFLIAIIVVLMILVGIIYNQSKNMNIQGGKL